MRIFRPWFVPLVLLLGALGCAIKRGLHMKFEVGAGEHVQAGPPKTTTNAPPSFPDPIEVK